MTEKTLNYNVVFEDSDKIRTWTSFQDKEDFDQWQSRQQVENRLTETPIARGIDEQEAHRLIDEVPIENYIARARRVSINPDTGLLNNKLFNFELNNVAYLQTLRTNCSFVKAEITVRLAAIKMIVSGITQR